MTLHHLAMASDEQYAAIILNSLPALFINLGKEYQEESLKTLLNKGTCSQLSSAFSLLFDNKRVKADKGVRVKIYQIFEALLRDIDISRDVIEAISLSPLIEAVLAEMTRPSYHELHTICESILAAYSSRCHQVTVGVDQLKPFASFCPSPERRAKPLRFNFVFECLGCLLKQASLTLAMMTACSSLLSMLFSQQDISVAILGCVLEITNQSLRSADSDDCPVNVSHVSHRTVNVRTRSHRNDCPEINVKTRDRDRDSDRDLLLAFLVDSGLLLFLTSIPLSRSLDPADGIVTTIQAIMRSNEKYVAMVSSCDISKTKAARFMKGFQV
jgi:hypothetical protein